MILHISEVFGSRHGATEILTMISMQKCLFQLYQKIEQMFMPVVYSIQLLTMIVWYIFTVWTFL